MNYEDVVSQVQVYGLYESVKGSKYPMAVDLANVNDEVTDRTKKLANAKTGSGHDNFLNGIVVQFDLTFTNKAWVEAERYHFLDFISSQSTMHRITKFDLDKAYISYVDERIIAIMKEKVKAYNELQEDIKRLREDAGMSQAELSRRLSVSQAFINRVENLRAKAPADLLIGVADIFGCTLDELAGRDRPA